MSVQLKMRSETREVPALDLRASFVPGTVDVEKRTVELVWTTGAPVLRGFYDRFWEELSLEPKHVRMGRLNSGAAPLLNSHDAYSLRGTIGVVEKAWLKGNEGRAIVRFARAEANPEAEQIFQGVKDGIIQNVSVGYRTYKFEQAEGGADKIPRYRATDWEPNEISMVPIGADAGAGVRAEGVTTNPCEFVREEIDMSIITKTEPQPVPAAGPTPAERAAEDQKIRAAENERVLGIQRIGKALGVPAEKIDEHVRGATTLAAFRDLAQDHFVATTHVETGAGGGVRIEMGEDARDKFVRGAGNWIAERAGVGKIIAEHARAKGEKVDTDGGEFRGMRLIDLAREALERAGVKTRGKLPMQLVGEALTMRALSGAASTGDFPMILENVLNKVLLGSYATTQDTWSKFCKRGSVSDFRASKRYRLGTFGALSALNELGEFENKAIPDAERQTLTAGTMGNIIGISRQAIINDDMGAFSSLATALGRSARLSVEVAVYALLAQNAGLGPTMGDGNPLFHASHGNITTGAALSAAALDLDRVAMGVQRDPSLNEVLDLSPAVLVVPKSLGGQARVINDSQYDPDTVANKAQFKANIAGKLFESIVDTGRLTGTRRYLFADPNIAPCIEVAFLDGQDAPFMDVENGWRVDGVEWKVRMDFGVGAIDWRPGITNAGV
jgi:hypothetical protein